MRINIHLQKNVKKAFFKISIELKICMKYSNCETFVSKMLPQLILSPKKGKNKQTITLLHHKMINDYKQLLLVIFFK